MNSIAVDVERGTWRPDAKISVDALLKSWLNAKMSEGISDSTAAMYSMVSDSWIVPHIGGLRLEQVNPQWAGKLVAALHADGSREGRGGLSPRSAQLAVQVLKASTRWAMETGLVAADPLIGFKRPKATARVDATSAWDAAEAAQFLAAVSDDQLRAAWWLFLGVGLRRGELCGLKWAAVDLEAGTARIVETRIVIDAHPTVSTPKTGKGRSVPLDPRLIGELKLHRKNQREERVAAGPAWANTDYLFVDETGKPYRPETISRTFTRLAKNVGLRPIRLHDLRHTAATLMLASGEPVKVVSEILGHSSPTITLEVYQHVLPGMGEAAVGRLTGLLTKQAVAPRS